MSYHTRLGTITDDRVVYSEMYNDYLNENMSEPDKLCRVSVDFVIGDRLGKNNGEPRSETLSEDSFFKLFLEEAFRIDPIAKVLST